MVEFDYKKHKMQKAILLVFLIWGLSCSNIQKMTADDSNGNMVSGQTGISTNKIVPEMKGVYKGILPCADCSGIEVTLNLKSGFMYELETKYLGEKDEIYRYSGTYYWNKKRNTIVLSELKNRPNQFFVGENYIVQLDMHGNRITGQLAQKYVLKKVK
jgi:uncharacterized lipoprotein NlpE involved in copper resistance